MAWTERNVGLEDQRVNYIAQNPATRNLLDSSFHELWAATDGGMFLTLNGGRQWGEIVLPDPDNSQFLDSPAATADDLLYIWVGYDPTDNQTIYVMAAAAVTSNRTWIYKTTDSGLTWINKGNFWV